MTPKVATSAAISLPSAEEFTDLPEAQAVAEAETLLDRLKSRAADERIKVNALAARVNRPMHERLQDAAGALLQNPAADLHEEDNVNRQAFTEASEDLRIAERAIVLQEKVIADLRAKFSREVCRALAPQHRALARVIVNAIVALAVASRNEQEFRDALTNDGVRVAFPAMTHARTGKLNDPNSAVRMYIAEARRQEFISEPELAQLIEGKSI